MNYDHSYNENISGISQGDIHVINKLQKDMKFVGIFTLIIGVFYCLSIIGAILGIPFIFAGIRLNEASDNLKAFLKTDNIKSLFDALEKQSRYFYIIKIFIIISIVLMAIYFVFIIIFLIYMLPEIFKELNKLNIKDFRRI